MTERAVRRSRVQRLVMPCEVDRAAVRSMAIVTGQFRCDKSILPRRAVPGRGGSMAFIAAHVLAHVMQ